MRFLIVALLAFFTTSAFADDSLRRCDRIERGKKGIVKRGDSLTHAWDVLGRPAAQGGGAMIYRKGRKTVYIYHQRGQVTDVCTEKN